MQTTPATTSNGLQDEISLGELALRTLRFYQRFGRLLVLLAVVVGVLIAGWIASRPLYSVTALIEAPKVNLEEWRQTQPFLWDSRWVARAFGADQGDDPQHLQLSKRALNPEFWTNTIRYRASLNRDDVRDVPTAQYQNSGGLGLELSLRVRNEEHAALLIAALAKQVREAFLANSLVTLVRETQATLDRRPQLKLDELKAAFEIEQNRQRIDDMRHLLERYPELRHLETGTVFSVSDGGGKYLSPLPQIVALESTVSELQAKSRAAQRDLETLDWTEKLLAGVDETIRNATSGQEIFDKLRNNREQLLAANPPLSASAREAAEALNLKLAQAESRQLAIGVKTRSAVSTKPVTQRNPLTMGLAAFLLAFIGLSIVLAIHAFLRKEREVLPWLPRPIRRWLIVDPTP